MDRLQILPRSVLATLIGFSSVDGLALGRNGVATESEPPHANGALMYNADSEPGARNIDTPLDAIDTPSMRPHMQSESSFISPGSEPIHPLSAPRN
jgi:hypothetical protein